jgi:hypothetical protein
MDVIIAAVLVIVAAHYGIPAFDNWQARRAMGKRLNQVIRGGER